MEGYMAGGNFEGEGASPASIPAPSTPRGRSPRPPLSSPGLSSGHVQSLLSGDAAFCDSIFQK